MRSRSLWLCISDYFVRAMERHTGMFGWMGLGGAPGWTMQRLVTLSNDLLSTYLVGYRKQIMLVNWLDHIHDLSILYRVPILHSEVCTK